MLAGFLYHIEYFSSYACYLPDILFSQAAFIMKKILRNMPKSIYDTLAKETKIGIFSDQEGITIFDEFKPYRDKPECKGIYLSNLDILAFLR